MLADEPVLYLQFENDAQDSGSAQSHGEAGDTTEFVPAFHPALGSHAVRFDASESSLINLGATNAPGSILEKLRGAPAVTVEFWMDFSKLEDRGGIFYIPGASTFPGFAVVSARVSDVERRGFAMGGRSRPQDEYNEVHTRLPNDTDVVHIVGVFDYEESTISIFANGELVSSMVLPFGNQRLNIPPGDNPVVIGRNSDFGIVGVIDELAIYDKALTPEQIRAHYEAATAP